MTEPIYLSLTTSELRALDTWLHQGGVVGEEGELDLERAKDVIRRRVAEDAGQEIVKTVDLTHEERKRLLFWLHWPVPPGPEKELDERLIRKLADDEHR